jgi:hypothetical protein
MATDQHDTSSSSSSSSSSSIPAISDTPNTSRAALNLELEARSAQRQSEAVWIAAKEGGIVGAEIAAVVAAVHYAGKHFAGMSGARIFCEGAKWGDEVMG